MEMHPITDVRIAELSHATTVDVFRALLAADLHSSAALRVAWPSPLPTVPAPGEAFHDSAGRPVDAFDFAVHEGRPVPGAAPVMCDLAALRSVGARRGQISPVSSSMPRRLAS